MTPKGKFHYCYCYLNLRKIQHKRVLCTYGLVYTAETVFLDSSDYFRWIAFLGTVFLFIFLSNWTGALFPWKFFIIPNGELAAPTNDINTTVALALLTSIAYFYAGLSKKGLGYFDLH